jgi:hypothetical protein
MMLSRLFSRVLEAHISLAVRTVAHICPPERIYHIPSVNGTCCEAQDHGPHIFAFVTPEIRRIKSPPRACKIEIGHDHVVRMFIDGMMCFIEYEKTDIGPDTYISMMKSV